VIPASTKINKAGFKETMSSLAFKESELINNAKISILFASVIAGLTGYFVLRKTLTFNYSANKKSSFEA